ncbi:MAG: heavy metal-associated domain-containing protein [candidate division WOR-3 bacterium]
MEKIKIKIEGMTCQGCVRSITKVLERMGAKEINVSLEKNEAEFLLENKEKLIEIKKEIELLGYVVEKF